MIGCEREVLSLGFVEIKETISRFQQKTMIKEQKRRYCLFCRIILLWLTPRLPLAYIL